MNTNPIAIPVHLDEIIAIPVHPDERDWPVSLVHIPLSKGRFATIQGPLSPKTLTALLGTLEANRDSLVSNSVDDFSI